MLVKLTPDVVVGKLSIFSFEADHSSKSSQMGSSSNSRALMALTGVLEGRPVDEKLNN